MTNQLLIALRDLTAAAEESGWDGDERRDVLNAARKALFDAGCVEGEPADDEDDDDSGEPRCNNPGGHSWAYTGTAYGWDDPSYMGEGRAYCEHCGADGDA